MSLDRILLIDDEPRILAGIRRVLARRYDVSCAESGESGLAAIDPDAPFAAVICDLKMPGMNGLDVLREFRRRAPGTVRMVLTGVGDMAAAITAVNEGEVFRFHTKPIEADVLLASVGAAIARFRTIAALDGSAAQASAEFAAAFAAAIAKGEMRLFVQPQFDAAANRVIGVEALIRWQHPERGLLFPLQFLSEVAASGAMGDLTAWMLDVACAAIADWRAGLDPDLAISVNIAASDLDSADFPDLVLDTLAHHRLPPAAIELELLESAAIDGDAGPRPVLESLTRAGIAFSIDDFGTGYSAFGYLRRLPVRQLKIDRIFVTDIAADADALRIVEAIVSLGRDLDLAVIAEGVETQAQQDALMRVGCHLFQGFHIARPMPAEDFPAWLAARS